MRIAVGFLVFIFLIISCEKIESKTPLVKPTEFDQKSYAENLKKQRDRLKTLSSKKHTPKKTSTSDSTTKVQPQKLAFTEKTDTVHVKIVYGKAKMDTVKLPLQKMVFVLDTDTANKLKLKITAQDSTANLRITQIISSNGVSDGPFGREVEFQIVQKGKHQILISENQMQGEAWGGRFTFEAQLGW